MIDYFYYPKGSTIIIHVGKTGGTSLGKGLREIRLKEKNKSSEILKLAVKRMLPGGPLAKKQLTKLKIYNDEKHPHENQKPKVINFDKLNKKNILR